MLNIRRAQHSDAQSIIDSHIRSIREVCSQDYTPRQIEAWSGRNFRVDMWRETMDKDLVWVVEIDSHVRGFGHLSFQNENVGEVMGLYFTPECRGLGAGKKLFQIMNELQLHATITAKTFYEMCGFKQVGDICNLEMRGVLIPCFSMSCKIN